jgi:hypothetical protein
MQTAQLRPQQRVGFCLAVAEFEPIFLDNYLSAKLGPCALLICKVQVDYE